MLFYHFFQIRLFNIKFKIFLIILYWKRKLIPLIHLIRKFYHLEVIINQFSKEELNMAKFILGLIVRLLHNSWFIKFSNYLFIVDKQCYMQQYSWDKCVFCLSYWLFLFILLKYLCGCLSSQFLISRLELFRWRI